MNLLWAAGLFEGEGSVSARRDRNRVRAIAQLKTTDHDVLLTFKTVVVVGNVSGPFHHHNRPDAYKPYWSWCASSQSDFKLFAQAIYPFLHSRRREQIMRVGEECNLTELIEYLRKWEAKVA